MLDNRPKLIRKVWIREYHGKRGTAYRVSYYDSSIKARRTLRSFHVKRLAVAYKNDYENFLNGTGPNPEVQHEDHAVHPPSRLWSEATAEWIESGATRDKTRITYRSMLKHFAERTNIACVEDVTEQTVSQFLASLKRRGKSLATCAAYLRTLAAFLRSACPEYSPVTEKLITRWAPYKNRKRARPHFFTHDEFQSLLKACDSIEVRTRDHRNSLWWKCFVSVLYHAGVRRNEAAHLIWRDIDFEHGILRIQPHVRLKGVFEWRPKGKARRAIPVPAEVMGFLANMQQNQEEGIPYVFLPYTRYHELLDNGGPKDEILCGIGKSFKRIREVGKIPEGTIQDMRRTCITNWAQNIELKPKDVQVLAGHEDLNTTLEIYAMVEEGDVVEKARRIICRADAEASGDIAAKADDS